MGVSSLLVFYNFLRSFVNGGWGSYSYRLVLVILFFGMFSLRVPYIYSFWGFSVFVCVIVIPLFVSILFVRLASFKEFLMSFIPVGCPGYLAPLVFVTELVSFFFIRFTILLIRPIINLTFGYAVTMLGCYLILWVEWPFVCGVGCVLWLFMFFYELFVLVIHWYIVCEVLSFSQNF